MLPDRPMVSILKHRDAGAAARFTAAIAEASPPVPHGKGGQVWSLKGERL